ncbi:hypothetical protein SDC9_142660 [bioreactor metagenome]|uniref:Uncharacterized protein n=1 Tax=bioreactor metagenome TaxID=1076179 RepID=A0A645E1S0_9ZZZZ
MQRDRHIRALEHVRRACDDLYRLAARLDFANQEVVRVLMLFYFRNAPDDDVCHVAHELFDGVRLKAAAHHQLLVFFARELHVGIFVEPFNW